ncbi:hypothetical protein MBCUR_07080 [Methanobrevibacter curvatus]|uniref:Uncharacterized protein n=1 Tax=Methanobrevibacter curvatus TaxID=49547 RepID=A0A166BDA3_9EURY|nr:hypothetical protein MBCUR_07080 [Methanobrevibacter curvatus]
MKQIFMHIQSLWIKTMLYNKTLLKKYPYNEIYIDMVIDLLERINLKNSFILRIDNLYLENM